MTLDEEVKWIVVNHDYSVDGVHSLTPKVISKVLDEVVEAYQYEANMQGIPYEAFDAIQKAIESLRDTDGSM